MNLFRKVIEAEILIGILSPILFSSTFFVSRLLHSTFSPCSVLIPFIIVFLTSPLTLHSTFPQQITSVQVKEAGDHSICGSSKAEHYGTLKVLWTHYNHNYSLSFVLSYTYFTRQEEENKEGHSRATYTTLYIYQDTIPFKGAEHEADLRTLDSSR